MLDSLKYDKHPANTGWPIVSPLIGPMYDHATVTHLGPLQIGDGEELPMTMLMNRQALSLCALLAATISVHPAQAQNAVTFTIDASQNVQAISRYIYGINQPITSGQHSTMIKALRPPAWCMVR